MASTLLYLPTANSAALAGHPVAGRSLTFRAVVASVRAGSVIIGVPSVLRDARAEAELARTPAVARAVRWLDASQAPAAPEEFCLASCLLVPASALVDARGLASLSSPPPSGTAVLAASAGSPAPTLAVPGNLVERLWPRLAAGIPIGRELIGRVAEGVAEARGDAALFVAVEDAASLHRAEERLYRTLGTGSDSAVDRLFHRRCSRWLTRMLTRTRVTPNQVTLASLALGAVAVWCSWQATVGSTLAALLFYALSSIVDHSDGELARLTFQESAFGARLDWIADTLVHSGLVIALAVTGGGALAIPLAVSAGGGVAASARLARSLPAEDEVRDPVLDVLRRLGSRDPFYLLLLAFVVCRAALPSLGTALVALVATGSNAYWIGCLARIRSTATHATAGRR